MTSVGLSAILRRDAKKTMLVKREKISVFVGLSFIKHFKVKR